MGNLMSKKRILAIVEGEKADYKLMKHLFDMFYEHEYDILPYRTNLYSLYNSFELNDKDDFEVLDTIQVLKSMEKDVKKRDMLNQKFTDIVLIFGFDPQDPAFSVEKIIKMKKLFHESTENGKLYINYPMVEAFKHLKNVKDESFIDLQVLKEDLDNKKYKTMVSQMAFQNDYTKYNRTMCLNVFRLNLIKANNMLNHKRSVPVNASEYFYIDLDEILMKQCELMKNTNAFFVLCTCIFFFLDYNTSYFLKEIECL